MGNPTGPKPQNYFHATPPIIIFFERGNILQSDHKFIENHNIKKKSQKKKKASIKWTIIIVLVTFIISIVLNFLSNTFLSGISIWLSFVILFFIVFLGVIFDIVGIAVAAADEIPFHAMAAKKIAGAKESIMLVRDADKVSSICNDVIGDIAGVISGVIVLTIVLEIQKINSVVSTLVLSIILTAITASLAVGGRAIGKNVAIRLSNNIVFKVGLFLHIFTLIKNKVRRNS